MEQDCSSFVWCAVADTPETDFEVGLRKHFKQGNNSIFPH